MFGSSAVKPGHLVARFVLRVFATLLGFAATQAVRAGECPTAGTVSVSLVAVEPGLELHLADGRLVRLAGVEAGTATPGDPRRSEAARSSLFETLKEHHLSIFPLSERTDRWGRIPAWVFADDGAVQGGGLATTVIAAGLGRYRPEPEAAPCRRELLAAEAAARRDRLGLWRDPYYSVLAVDDQTAFAERVGTNVLVEARLVAVEAGPYRIRLRFAGVGDGRRLEATIMPRAMKTFEAQGVDFSSLIGRTLRLRGLLDRRFGPRIELARPDEVEILPPPGPPSPTAPSSSRQD